MPSALLTSLWPLRVVWVALSIGAAPALAGALADASTPVGVVAAVGLWAGWAATLLALLVPRAVSLTAVRLGGPAALAATVAAAVRGPAGVDDAVAVALAATAAVLALSAPVADAMVDGSGYGDERRFTLRTPAPLVVAAAVAWVLAVVAPAAAALALAARAWVPGAVLAAVGVAGVALGGPALHRLSRRWLVFVPAGVVVHDHLTLADPVLLRRTAIRAAGPATTDGADGDEGTVDLTAGAGGLVLAVVLARPQELSVVRGAGPDRQATAASADRILVTPVRPGAVLAEARRRRIGTP